MPDIEIRIENKSCHQALVLIFRKKTLSPLQTISLKEEPIFIAFKEAGWKSTPCL